MRYWSKKFEEKEFGKNIDRNRMFICTDINDKLLELNRDFNTIVEQVDNLFSGGYSFKSVDRRLFFSLFQNRSIELDIGYIRDNLIE